MTIIQKLYHNLSAIFFLIANISVVSIMSGNPKKVFMRTGISALIVLLFIIMYVHLLAGGSGIFKTVPVAFMFIPVYFFGLHKLRFCHGLFIISAELAITQLISVIVAFIAQQIWQYETDVYCIAMIILLVIVLILYVLLIYKFGKQITIKLFTYTSDKVWIFYSFFCLFIVFTAKYFYLSPDTLTPIYLEKDAYALILPALMVSLFALMFVSILSTHAKLAAQYELGMAQSVINSGREYYDKLAFMTENLQRLRHDHKFQLRTILKLLDGGEADEARSYTSTLDEKINETYVQDYCGSRVVNALLSSFADRCKEENIGFLTQIEMDGKLDLDEYELCVILGNLLENAITACVQIPPDRKRLIDLVVRRHNDQLGIMVENSFDGVLKHDGKILYSTKRDGGGLGISSIKSVALRHKGEYVPVWDDEKFSAYVVLKLEDE